jgi:hypothetical protein
MTITFGWWLLPLAISAAVWLRFAIQVNGRSANLGNAILGFAELLYSLIITLFVWLIWALLR